MELFDIKALLEKVVPNQTENNVFQSQFLVAKDSKVDSNAIIMPHLNPFCGGFSTSIETFCLMLKNLICFYASTRLTVNCIFKELKIVFQQSLNLILGCDNSTFKYHIARIQTLILIFEFKFSF
ncbi:MAG: hypothetical protein IJX02_02885 [Clostridia bacterium]|nr:hypothetical protein [Clostridia bacterium]